LVVEQEVVNTAAKANRGRIRGGLHHDLPVAAGFIKKLTPQQAGDAIQIIINKASCVYFRLSKARRSYNSRALNL
jgi:hypothetical protein